MAREMTRTTRKEREHDAFRVPDFSWNQYFSFDPSVPGTEVLMRVYEALFQRRINFYFSYHLGDALQTVGIKESVRAHFFLPDHNIAIQVAGGYWYDKGDNVNDTALEVALIEQAGIKCIFWTEPEIEYWGMDELISREPELNVPHEVGGPMDLDYAPIDYRGAAYKPGHPLRRQPKETIRGRRYGD